jgi:hypothetical protein
MSSCRFSRVKPVFLVHPVCLVHLVYLVERNEPDQQNEPKKPNEPNQPSAYPPIPLPLTPATFSLNPWIATKTIET